jgi:hypothetical protein
MGRALDVLQSLGANSNSDVYVITAISIHLSPGKLQTNIIMPPCRACARISPSSHSFDFAGIIKLFPSLTPEDGYRNFGTEDAMMPYTLPMSGSR